MIDKRRKIFDKIFALLLSDKGFDEVMIKSAFSCLLTASEIAQFYIENEVIITLFDNIKERFAEENFSNEGLDKVVHFLNNVRTGKFDYKEVPNE